MNLKKFILKLTALFMAVSILFGNCSLFCFGIKKVIAEDENTPKVEISLENSKYVQYSDEIKKGVAIKSKLTLSIDNNDSHLPVEETNIDVRLPKINNCYPEKAVVILASTKITTGEENNELVNQSYEIASGKLSMQYKNAQNYSNNNNELKDEFEIIYIYAKEAYVGEQDITLQYAIDAKMSFKTENGNIISQTTKNIEINEKEKKGDLLEFTTTKLLGEGKIYKGFLYANVENGTEYNTIYETVSSLSVLNSEVATELEMELQESKFIKSDNKTEIIANGNIVYNKTQISKLEFDKIFGMDGVIEFYNEEKLIATVKYLKDEKENKLAVIYSDDNIKFVENSNIEVEYGEARNIKIKTSKPILEGFINLVNTNTIKSSKNYGANIKDLKYIQITNLIKDEEKMQKIPLTEPETKISISSSNVNFSTLQANKTTLTVKLDDTNSSTKLFDNPTITIKLPDGLTSGNLSSPEIVNGNGLEIESTFANDNNITINLKGKQTTYDLNNVSGGVSIVMDIDNINYKNTLPTHEDIIEMVCAQNKSEVKSNCKVNINSKAGLLLLAKISGYDNNNTVTTSIDSTIKEIRVAHNANEREIVQTLTLVNNYLDDLTNVEIIGNLAYANSELSSTLNIPLTKEIELNKENTKIYYSTGEQENSWTEEFMPNAKLYKVVLSDNKLEKMDNIQINIHMKLPANIGYNQSTYIKTDVNYVVNNQKINDNSTMKIITEENKLTMFSVKSDNYSLTKDGIGEKGTNNNISLSITPNITEKYLHSGQIVNYKLLVANNSTETLKDLQLIYTVKQDLEILIEGEIKEGQAADYLEYVEYPDARQKVWNIEELKQGEAKEFDLMLKIKEVSSSVNKIDHVALYYNGQYEQTLQEVDLGIEIKPTLITVSLKTEAEQQIDKIYHAGEIVEYIIFIDNISNNDIKDALLKFNVPKELTYIDGGLATYKDFEGYIIEESGKVNNNVFEYKINKIKSEEEKVIVLRCRVNRLQSIYEANIIAIAQLELEEDMYESNSNEINTIQAAYNVNIDSPQKNSTLKVGDKVEYNITVNNVGKDAEQFDIRTKIPNTIKVNLLEYNKEGEDKKSLSTSEQTVKVTYKLDKNEILKIRIEGEVIEQEVEKDTTLSLETISEIIVNEDLVQKSNTVFMKVLQNGKVNDPEDPNGDPENPGNPDEPNKPTEPDEPVVPSKPEENKLYNISGIAWIDANKNGKFDENEKLQDSVIASLMNADTGKYVLNSEGNKITSTTDANGKYEFNNIAKGTYTVVFEFDTNTYTVTTYKKEDVEDSLNSDAIITNTVIEGNKKLVGITDKLEIKNANLENINIGLIENATFDLKLNKEITKITVNNAKGTEETTYKNGKTAKIDLVAKYMNNATVIVNYRFTITNDGDVTGYVNNLVDTLPSGLEFSSELNKDWYKGTDGKLYTTSLSGVAVKPGENMYVELVLTKNMTEDNVGVFTNEATLEKISNLEGITEKQEAKENNTSKALLIISIKTGTAILYIGITIICLLLIVAGSYLINKKVLNKNI